MLFSQVATVHLRSWARSSVATRSIASSAISSTRAMHQASRPSLLLSLQGQTGIFSRAQHNATGLRIRTLATSFGGSGLLNIRPTSQRSLLLSAQPRGQQTRGGRWEQHTKADYGSKRGNNYRNSGNNRRPFFDTLTPEATVYMIIAINGVVFLMWQSANGKMRSFQDTKMLRWMTANFTTMWMNLREGRIWTLITPAFSHVDTMHLLVNMFVLHSFGTDIAKTLGPKRFIAFYLGAAFCGNLISAVIRGIVLPYNTGDLRTMVQPSLGASTSVVGVTTLFACLYPHARLLLFFVVPVPAWLATVGFIGWDMTNLVRSGRTKTDGAGHLGGAAAGLAYYWFRLRPLIRRMR